MGPSRGPMDRVRQPPRTPENVKIHDIQAPPGSFPIPDSPFPSADPACLGNLGSGMTPCGPEIRPDHIIPPGMPIIPMPVPLIPIPPIGPALKNGSVPPGGMMILLGFDGLRGSLASWASSALALTAHGLLGHRRGI